MQDPCVVRVGRGRYGIAFPARIVKKLIGAAPVLKVEGRVGHDVVDLLVLMLVFLEGRDGFLAKVVRYAADGKVHLA